MIKNDLEYSVTKSWIEKFGRTLAALEQDEEKKKKDPDGWQLHHDGVLSQLEELQKQIAEYENLIAHDPNQPVALKIDDINKLSDLLIKARIAFKITQKELAFLCDRTEEQIQAYEDKDYQNASFLDFLAVSDALGIQIQEGSFFAELYDFYKDRIAVIRHNSSTHFPKTSAKR